MIIKDHITGRYTVISNKEKRMFNVKYMIWALLAGAFIPLIGILNARVGRALGEPIYATVIVFLVAILVALLVSLVFGKSVPMTQNLKNLATFDNFQNSPGLLRSRLQKFTKGFHDFFITICSRHFTEIFKGFK